MPQIYDISQTLAPGIAVWPGDTVFQTFWVMRMDAGDSCNVGSVTMSLHTGTHADAPLHFNANGASPGDANLDAYIGPALVLDCGGANAITPVHVDGCPSSHPKRILFKTGTSSPDRFEGDFSYFTAEAAKALVALGVKLVGIDTPSVDASDSKSLDAHHIFADAGIAILENLNLSAVAPGEYELIALPLKLAGMDASPVRAILRAME